MRQVQYVSKYLALSEEGLVPKILCPMDQGLLLSNQTVDEEIYLYCLSCNYKKVLGAEVYDKIVNAVKTVGKSRRT